MNFAQSTIYNYNRQNFPISKSNLHKGSEYDGKCSHGTTRRYKFIQNLAWQHCPQRMTAVSLTARQLCCHAVGECRMIINQCIIQVIAHWTCRARNNRTNRSHKQKSSNSHRSSDKPPAHKYTYSFYRKAKITLDLSRDEFGFFCYAQNRQAIGSVGCRSPPYQSFFKTKND